MMLKNKTKWRSVKQNKKPYSVTKIFNQSRKERKDKRKLSILPTYFLVVKSIAPAPPPSGQHIFANLKSSQEKKKRKYYSQKIRARNSKDNNVFAHCPTKHTNFFLFSAIFRMLRFSKREKSTEKKSTKDD